MCAHFGGRTFLFLDRKKEFEMKKLTCVLLLLTVCLCLFACEGEKIVWDDIILGEMLPPPPSNEGAVHENSAEDLWVSIDGLSDKQFNDYIKVKFYSKQTV